MAHTLRLFLFFVFLLLGARYATAQNLVPNPSFEDTVACPTSISQIDYAIGWSSYRQSPDYFNACSTGSLPVSVSVPSNQWGYQYPRTGNAYAGFGALQTISTDLREYPGIQLSQPLTIGQKYFASFYVSRAVSPTPYMNVAINKIGIRLSTMSFSTSNWEPVDNYAQIFTDSIITDTLNWIEISGTFTADSAYEYLSIGNFFQDSLTAYIRYDSTSTWAYYYIDDVYLAVDSAVGIAASKNDDLIRVFPNPAKDWITIQGRGIYKISLYDISGSPFLFYEVSPTSSLRINISDITKGVYFISVKTLNENVTKKLIIN